jgi:hypothetical protein
MSFALIYIRYLQAIRILKDGGLGSILLPFLIIGLSIASYKAYDNMRYGALLTAILVALCVSLHMRRKDKIFAQLHLSKYHLQMYVEYILLTLPFAITTIFTPHFFYYPLLLTLLWFVPYLSYSPTQKTNLKNISKLFATAHSIEWVSGLRNSFLTILPLYALALATCWMRFLPLLLLWLITTAILNFYSEHEAIHILRAQHNNAKDFLSEKIKVHCFYVCIFYAPVLILNSIFNHDFIEINVLFLLVQFSLIIFAINAKYSSYIPAQQNLASNISVAIISIASIVPYLLPLPVIFAVVYYNKAIQNLKKYFYD